MMDLKIICLLLVVSFANAEKYMTVYSSQQGLTFYGDSRPWCSAVQACIGRYQHLGIINSETLNIASSKIIQSGKRAWLGASDMYTEGHWIWFDSSQVYSGYYMWAGGEPNNDNNEDCMEAGGKGTYYWNDEGCGDSHGYICQISTSRQLPAMYSVLSFSDTISTSNSRTTFSNAKQECESKGMRLARVDSREEFQILQNQLPRNSNEKYWIGTKHGKCVAMNNKDLEFTDCSSTALPFICEVVSPYAVEVSDESPKIHENDNLQIDCKASGFPLPDVFWYKDGERITEQTDQHLHQSIGSASATLKIDRAQMGDAGEYRCYAANTANNFELNVFGLLMMEVYTEGEEEIERVTENLDFWQRLENY
uniref:uncharacterized protein LOC120338792 isoform X1 n=2 Tax=Styela clava TaxID=7725 RepID=UPI001939BC05|nr:uncharacterized protein LOC120338792 isoform X1 [Styela clava]XP_039262678.1 uncharacterized protein LOC120338792 isoform X1 [Styela clava]